MLLKRFILLYLLTFSTCMYGNTIILDPGGQDENLGRRLKHGYERGTSLNLCEKIKELLNKQPNIKAILARNAGEKRTLKQTIALANQLKPQLYIRFHVAQHEHAKPRINIYYRLTNKLISVSSHKNTLEFIPVSKSHKRNQSATKTLGANLAKHLSNPEIKPLVDTFGPFGLPLISFKGLVPPALLIEVSSNNEHSINILVKHIAQCITKLFSNKNKIIPGQNPSIE